MPESLNGFLWVLTGPTAAGKGGVAREIARRTGAEVVSADSMKVYRGLDVGTAKPTAEERRGIPHHLIDVADPAEAFSLGRYVSEADRAIADIVGRGRPALVCGGTPLYLRGLLAGVCEAPPADGALRLELAAEARSRGPELLHARLEELDPAAAARLHPHDAKRIVRALEVALRTGGPLSARQREFGRSSPRYRYALAALGREDPDLASRIRRRVARMFERGLADEVRRLCRHPEGFGKTARSAVGYREMLDHLAGRVGLAETRERIVRNTWRLARKQRTWFRSFPGLRWAPAGEGESVAATVERVLETWRRSAAS